MYCMMSLRFIYQKKVYKFRIPFRKGSGIKKQRFNLKWRMIMLKDVSIGKMPNRWKTRSVYMGYRNKQGGFTFVSMMLAIALLGIIFPLIGYTYQAVHIPSITG